MAKVLKLLGCESDVALTYIMDFGHWIFENSVTYDQMLKLEELNGQNLRLYIICKRQNCQTNITVSGS